MTASAFAVVALGLAAASLVALLRPVSGEPRPIWRRRAFQGGAQVVLLGSALLVGIDPSALILPTVGLGLAALLLAVGWRRPPDAEPPIEPARPADRAEVGLDGVARLFSLSPDLLCILDREGRFLLRNPAFEHLAGGSSGGSGLVDFVHPDDQAMVVRELALLADQEAARVFECRCLTGPRASRPFAWTAVSTPEQMVYAVGHDVTLLKGAQLDLVRAKEAAESSSRAKSEFLAQMSHEIRTPLNSVIGFAHVLLRNRDGHLSERELGFLKRIESNGRHLLILINEILDIAKIEAGKIELSPSRFDLGALVTETLEQFAERAEGSPVALLAELPEELEPIETDRGRLKQVLINLVGNALKFTPEGTVTVRVRAGSTSGRPHALEIEDTGVGIPPDRLDVIFQAFTQADSGLTRRHEGTGLGLAISRSLTERMGFGLEVESELDRGSTFRIVFAGKPEAPDLRTTTQRIRPLRRGELVAAEASLLAGVRVLLLEANEEDRRASADVIRAHGGTVLEASTPDDASRYSARYQPDVVVVGLLTACQGGLSALDPQPTVPILVVGLGGNRSGIEVVSEEALVAAVERRHSL